MAFPYNNDIANYTASFPSGVFTPRNVKNEDKNGYAITGETFNVPASPDGEGRYRMNLDQVPLQQIGMTVTVGAAARKPIPYGEAPAEGEVAISMDNGAIEFNSADAGGSCVANYTGKGTPIMAYIINQLGKELAAAQTKILGLEGEIDMLSSIVTALDAEVEGLGDVNGPESSTDNAIARFDSTTGKVIQNSNVTIDDSGNLVTSGSLSSSNLKTASTGKIIIGGSGTTTASVGNGNVLLGDSFPNITAGAVGNIVAGYQAGDALISADYNVILGYQAGSSLTESAGGGQLATMNVLIGYRAGNALTSAEQCIMIGRDAGLIATTGIANVLIGESAGKALTTGWDNVFVGSDAGWNGQDTSGAGFTTGAHNVFVGNNAGMTFTGVDGSFNFVLPEIPNSGSNNTAIGHDTGFSGGTANYRTAIGSGAIADQDNSIVLGRVADTTFMRGNANVGGNLSVAAQPHCVVYNSTGQSIPASTPTALTFDSEETDPTNMHSTASNTSRVNVTAGRWLVVFSTFNTASITGECFINVRVGGSVVKNSGMTTRRSGSIAAAEYWAGATILNITSSTYIEVFVNHTHSGGSMTFGTSASDAALNVLSVYKLP